MSFLDRWSPWRLRARLAVTEEEFDDACDRFRVQALTLTECRMERNAAREALKRVTPERDEARGHLQALQSAASQLVDGLGSDVTAVERLLPEAPDA